MRCFLGWEGATTFLHNGKRGPPHSSEERKEPTAMGKPYTEGAGPSRLFIEKLFRGKRTYISTIGKRNSVPGTEI